MIGPKKLASLREMAALARRHAYAPYSRFKVGAAVLTSGDRVFLGSNVENSSYGLTMCAERSAIFQAVGAGQANIRAVVVVTDSPSPAPCCGACLQVLSEFGKGAVVASFTTSGKGKIWRFSELYPVPFGSEDIAES